MASSSGTTNMGNDFSRIGKENRHLMQKIEGMSEINVSLLTFNGGIFRVPEILHAVNESSYTPRVISIGPFHRNGVGLQFMEQQKGRFLYELLRSGDGEYKVDKMLTIIRSCESKVRKSYGEHFELSSDDFVMMVLLDGLFIIEYFRRMRNTTMRDENDKILYGSKLSKSIMHDLVLLENQLPYFIFEALYENVLPPNQLDEVPFFKICFDSFPYFRIRNNIPTPEGYETANYSCILKSGPVLHFIDLVTRIHVMPLSPTEICMRPLSKKTVSRQHLSAYSAKELKEHGINFQVSSSAKHLLDVKFTANGVFQIPRLEIFDETESLFRNMMAWEQYKQYEYSQRKYICDYVCLMDRLIDTFEDVELLVQNRIISNNIGDPEKVASLFNNLNREIMNNSVEDSYYYPIYKDLDSYYKMQWPKWKTTLIKEYFGTPWKVASVSAAAILLLLTLLQTINSFKS